jgi:hypothetical protein
MAHGHTPWYAPPPSPTPIPMHPHFPPAPQHLHYGLGGQVCPSFPGHGQLSAPAPAQSWGTPPLNEPIPSLEGPVSFNYNFVMPAFRTSSSSSSSFSAPLQPYPSTLPPADSASDGRPVSLLPGTQPGSRPQHTGQYRTGTLASNGSNIATPTFASITDIQANI